MLAALILLANQTVFPLSDGRGELEWVSPCSFRVARYWGKAPAGETPINPEAVPVTGSDRGATVRFATGCVTVEVEKATLRLEVTGRAGRVLVDAAAPRRTPQGLVVERAALPGESFFGLGPRADPSADLRGRRVAAARPLLISSLGYGEFFPLSGSYVYDLALSQPDRRRVVLQGLDRVEYFIYYGVTPREILEEHAALTGTFAALDSRAFQLLEPAQVPRSATRIAARGQGSWTSLRETVQSLVHASWSALLVSAVDLSPYQNAPDLLFARAAQLGAVVPILYAVPHRPGPLRWTQEMRRRLTPYLVTCAYEARQFGFPMLRPIAMQSPGDREAAARETTEFMLGDALLAAPIFTPAGRRTVYLPAGTWTNLRTDQVYRGRQTIDIQAAENELPLFAKHASVLPLASLDEADLLTLTYFAGHGAEFLLLEEDANAVSQFHAAPAGDMLRLEILSARERTYEWIVRHASSCGKVVSGGVEFTPVKSRCELRTGTWFRDPANNEIRIRTLVPAGSERILHLETGDSTLNTPISRRMGSAK
ncbi:MAG: hypothetical protein HY822_12200 [Acidobacteria bacterium]|nr:hypothetical protein [Acidobacteriota bacterium]